MILAIFIALVVHVALLYSFALLALLDTRDTCRRIEAKLDAAMKHFEVKQ